MACGRSWFFRVDLKVAQKLNDCIGSNERRTFDPSAGQPTARLECCTCSGRVWGRREDDGEGTTPTYVFAYEGSPIRRMLSTGWKRARMSIGLPQLRVHDLKHTFGRRLRAAGVGFEDRQDLLGHRSCRITMHCSAVDLTQLIEAAELVREREGRRPGSAVLEGKPVELCRTTPASAVIAVAAMLPNA